jgi:hypothetical protein
MKRAQKTIKVLPFYHYIKVKMMGQKPSFCGVTSFRIINNLNLKPSALSELQSDEQCNKIITLSLTIVDKNKGHPEVCLCFKLMKGLMPPVSHHDVVCSVAYCTYDMQLQTAILCNGID